MLKISNRKPVAREKERIMPQTLVHSHYLPLTMRQRHEYQLEDLFDNDKIASKLPLAENRILMAFERAEFVSRGQIYKTDNFITDVGSTLDDLGDYVIENIVDNSNNRHGIVCLTELNNLPKLQKRALPTSVLKTIVSNIERQLVDIKLIELDDQSHIWFGKYSDREPESWNVDSTMNRLSDKKIAKQVRNINRQIRCEELYGGPLMTMHGSIE